MALRKRPFDDDAQYVISGLQLNRLRSLALNLAEYGKIYREQTYRPARYDIAKEIGEGCGLYTEEAWVKLARGECMRMAADEQEPNGFNALDIITRDYPHFFPHLNGEMAQASIEDAISDELAPAGWYHPSDEGPDND